MAQVNITINTDNAAFCDQEGEETGRILKTLSDTLRMNQDQLFNDLPQKVNLRDFNGNTIGECKIISS